MMALVKLHIIKAWAWLHTPLGDSIALALMCLVWFAAGYKLCWLLWCCGVVK